MKVTPLAAQQVGIPLFSIPKKQPGHKKAEVTLFDLSSHSRARAAIGFGLKVRHLKFNIFVVGEDRSGRLKATMAFLNQHVHLLPPPFDWVYLNNFVSAHRPKPFKLPAGMGSRLTKHLQELVESILVLFSKAFSRPDFLAQVEALSANVEKALHHQMEHLRVYATQKGFDIKHTPQGFFIQQQPGVDPNDGLGEIKEKLNRFTTTAHLAERKVSQDIKQAKETIAAQAIDPLMKRFRDKYEAYLGEWINELEEDLITNLDSLADDNGEAQLKPTVAERYAVNLLVNNHKMTHPKVILEANPTYENLFGSIKYRALPGGGLETSFVMIRPGALHKANGGILVLRAEALAKDPLAWGALKVALRDQCIVIEETNREHMIPLFDAPAPKPIPLDIQIFLVGAPYWYYNFFYLDPDFRTYFKIKADIEPSMRATPENTFLLAQLIQQNARKQAHVAISQEAIEYLFGYSARWVEDRSKIPSRFEILEDVLGEASVLTQMRAGKVITRHDICKVLQDRRTRNATQEDRVLEEIKENKIIIHTQGKVIGQINALSVNGGLDHFFGMPARITAQTYPGELGVINIERLVNMGGPIQQKGALVLEGFLNGYFAQKFSVAFSCSLTFEQNYNDIDGDSASLAELLAILSSLADIPLRQDIAVTGSIDQLGAVQAVGGVIHKIEGFYQACKMHGLTATQGVIIPAINASNVILREEVVDSIMKHEFFLWPVNTVFEALELITGVTAGLQDAHKNFTAGSVFAAVHKKLTKYNRIIVQKQKK